MAFVQTLLLSSGWSDIPWPTPVPKYTETNILLALRGLANLYQVKADGSVVGLGDWNKFVSKPNRFTIKRFSVFALSFADDEVSQAF
jgi:hypothetical protein